MIHVVELARAVHARAWFAFDQADFARKVYAGDPCEPWQVFDVISARELLALLDLSPDAPHVAERAPAIWALAARHGWDTTLYRADYLLGAGVLQPQPVAEAAACAAALAHRAPRWRVFWSDEQAGAALEQDPGLNSGGGFRAREALRAQLIALEILEGY